MKQSNDLGYFPVIPKNILLSARVEWSVREHPLISILSCYSMSCLSQIPSGNLTNSLRHRKWPLKCREFSHEKWVDFSIVFVCLHRGYMEPHGTRGPFHVFRQGSIGGAQVAIAFASNGPEVEIAHQTRKIRSRPCSKCWFHFLKMTPTWFSKV